jgi:hypothetical protein
MSHQLIVCSGGFDLRDKQEIQDLVETLGGSYSADLTTVVNLLVSASSDMQKHRTAEEVLQIPIVSYDWVVASKEKHKLLRNFASFRLKIFDRMQIWTYPPMPLKSMIVANGGKHLLDYRPSCTVIVSTEEKLPTLQLFNYSAPIVTEAWVRESVRLKRRLDFETFKIQCAESPRADEKLFLSSCVVYLHKLSEPELSLQRNLVIGGGGTFSLKLIPLVTHVVAEEPLKTHAKVVNLNWLKECCIKETKLTVEAFRQLIT